MSVSESVSRMFPIGSFHYVYVSHVEDGPNSFFIQLKADADSFLPRFSKCLKMEPPVLVECPLLPGSSVMTHVSSDDTFRRSTVLNVRHSVCKVYHIDYGNNEEIPFSKIFLLPKWANHVTAKAMQFRLSGTSSIEITDITKKNFCDLLEGKEATIRVAAQENNGPLLQYCEIFCQGRNVKDLLMNFDTPLEYPIEYPARGNNKEFIVTMSHVVSPSKFFVKFSNSTELVKTINEAVTSYCRQRNPLKDLFGVKLGTPVAALLNDKICCRGMVVGLLKDSAQVLFVDYGTSTTVSPNYLWEISRDHVTSWSAQAIECCLQGFENKDGTEINEEVITAMELTMLQKFEMKPLYTLPDNRLLVELFDDFGGKLSKKLLYLAGSCKIPLLQTVMTSEENSEPVFSLGLQPSCSKLKIKRQKFCLRPRLPPTCTQKMQVSNEDVLTLARENHDNPTDFSKHDHNNQNTFASKMNKLNLTLESMDSGISGQNGLAFEDNMSLTSSINSFGENGFVAVSTPKEEKYDSVYSYKPTEEMKRQLEYALNNNKKLFGGGFNDLGGQRPSMKLKWKYSCDSCQEEQTKPRDKVSDNGCEEDREDEFNKNSGFPHSNLEEGSIINGNKQWFNDEDYKSFTKPIMLSSPRQKGGGSKVLTTNRSQKKSDDDKNLKTESLNSDMARLSTFTSFPINTCIDKKMKKNSMKVYSEYPMPEIAVNEELNVFVSSLVNPHLFYVQRANSERDLNELKSSINTLQKGLRPIKEDCLVPGMPVLAKFSEDQAFYRAYVIKLKPLKKVQVAYVDYGNSEIVAESELYYVPCEFMNMPPLALRCSLANVKPVAHTWSEDPSDFNDIINSEHCLKMTIKSAKFIDGEIRFGVELVSPDGISVSRKLVDSGLALKAST